MALLNRFSNLFTADMHAVLDRLEEPQVLLNHALREMRDEVAKSAERLRRDELSREQLQHRADEATRALTDLDEQLDLCFASGEEALAKSLVKRKLGQISINKSLLDKLAQTNKTIEVARARHTEQLQTLESLQQKAELVTEQTNPIQDSSVTVLETGISDEDIAVAFLREKHQRTRS